MTDLGAEAALDAEHGNPYVELPQWLAETQVRKSPLPGPACVFNLGSLPEKKKETKTPVKKREYKPRYSSETEALRKKGNQQKSEYLKTNQQAQSKILVEKLEKVMDRIEKDGTLFEKYLADIKKKHIKIDKSFEERVEASREIVKIIKNFFETIDLTISIKNAKDHAMETWKNMEARAKTDMEKCIEEFNETKEKYAKSKEEHERKLQSILNTKAQFDTEIQTWKEREKRASIYLEEKIKSWQNSLVINEEQVKKNIEAMHQQQCNEAEKHREFEAKNQNMKELEARVKAEIDKLEILHNKLAEEQAKHEKCIKEMEKLKAWIKGGPSSKSK